MKEWKAVPLDQRKKESLSVRTKYPDRFPVICYALQRGGSPPPALDKHKYLVPGDLSMGQLIFVIRKRMKVPSTQALFFFVDGIIPKNTDTISSVYTKYRDPDGFLYVTYSCENTFGSSTCKMA